MIVFELLEKVMSYSGILRLEARRVGTARRVPSLGISIYIYIQKDGICLVKDQWSYPSSASVARGGAGRLLRLN